MVERVARIAGPTIMVDWANVAPRNLRFMRVSVWMDTEQPLVEGCMLRRDDGVMMWLRFRYERVGKICRRCGVIRHSNPHCPFLNPEIERMIQSQLEYVRYRFGYNIGLDLQNVLFTNELRAYHRRRGRRIIGAQVRRRQPNNHFEEPEPMEMGEPGEYVGDDQLMNLNHDHCDNLNQVQDNQDAQRGRASTEDATLTEQTMQPVTFHNQELENPQASDMYHQQPKNPLSQDPLIQPVNNIPRWINIPNEGAFFTNARLNDSLAEDIPKSSAMAEQRAARTQQMIDPNCVAHTEVSFQIPNQGEIITTSQKSPSKEDHTHGCNASIPLTDNDDTNNNCLSLPESGNTIVKDQIFGNLPPILNTRMGLGDESLLELENMNESRDMVHIGLTLNNNEIEHTIQATSFSFENPQGREVKMDIWPNRKRGHEEEHTEFEERRLRRRIIRMKR
ncbi:hypothetical protein PTKIN_Ptkin06aG0085000 [Pterospermum kingtungense]